MHRLHPHLAGPQSLKDTGGSGRSAVDRWCPRNGLLVSAEDPTALLSEKGGSEGKLLGAGEEAETEAGGHCERLSFSNSRYRIQMGIFDSQLQY